VARERGRRVGRLDESKPSEGVEVRVESDEIESGDVQRVERVVLSSREFPPSSSGEDERRREAPNQTKADLDVRSHLHAELNSLFPRSFSTAQRRGRRGRI
jgi:hypothetical protein